MYLKMFVSEQPPVSESESSTFRRDETYGQLRVPPQIEVESSLNERESDNQEILEECDFHLTASQKSMSRKDINLGRSTKSVSFKEEQKVITKKNIPHIAGEIIQERLLTVNKQLQDMRERNIEVQQEIDEAYACENPKLMEVILEHILFHWDDIMDVLIAELLEEEVLELNQIERMKSGHNSKPKETKLADKSLHGKFYDYKSVDLKDIMSIFNEYKEAETSIKNRM